MLGDRQTVHPVVDVAGAVVERDGQPVGVPARDDYGRATTLQCRFRGLTPGFGAGGFGG
jgi:hypothetical protein